MYTSSNVYGNGVSNPVTRTMGPRRYSIAFSARIALISAPNPAVRGASYTTTARPVFFPRGAIQFLGLEEHDGIGVADRGGEEALRLLRRRGHDDLEPGRVAEVRLGRLGVVMASADATAERRADRHRDGELASGPVAHLRGLGNDLVERRVDEVHELDLGDRTKAVEGHPDRGPNDSSLREGRIEDAVGEFVQEALRATEDAAVAADVFSEDDYAVVPSHLFAQRVVDRLDHRHRRHVHDLVA